MSLEDFHNQSRAAWIAAIEHAAGMNPAPTTVWLGADAIRHAIAPFLGINANHAHLPTGGGRDFHEVERAKEAGCLDFQVDARSMYRLKADQLTLEYIPEAPAESFLFLEAGPLRSVTGRSSNQEETLELASGELLDRDVWDRGFLGYDDDGREIPIPDDANLVVRWLGGKFLLVTKGSMWNGDASTYDGRHNKMSAADIRAMILRSLA